MSNNLPALIDPETTKTLMVMSDNFFKSGLYPNIKNPAGAFAVVQYGRELGIPPMTSMQTMAIVSGKITMMGNMLQTLLIRGGVKISILESTVKNCTLRFEREGYPSIQTSFSIEDAKRAGLYKEGSGYTKYPEEMLYWRAMAKGGRRIGSDLMLGVYAREEIEGDGSIIDVTPTEKKDTSVKKFDTTKYKDPVAPPIDCGPVDAVPDMNAPEITVSPLGMGIIYNDPDILNVPIDEGPMIPLTESVTIGHDEMQDMPKQPAQELFETLQVTIKEIETSGNKFRWRNWLKKYTKEINSLKELDEGLWKVIADYVAFINNKKWNK